MKPTRLARKTHIRPSSDTILFDMTDRTEGDCALPLSQCRASLQQDYGNLESESFASQKDILVWCANLLMESPSAGRMWAEAEKDGWSIGFGDLKNNGFMIDDRAKCIVLDHFALSPSALGRSAWFRNALLVTLIRALRDLWHDTRETDEQGTYVPEDFLMLERIRAADCDTFALLAGWELRGAGYGEVWRHMIGAPEGDMAMVFARHLERDPAAMFDGSALAYAFRQWFTDETRVNAVDHQTLNALDDRIAEGGFGSEKLSGNAIEALSELPGGIFYLRGLGDSVRSDPFFAGLHDPINQTHLFHLVYDADVTMVNNVPFRDRRLAMLIFPEGSADPVH